MGEETTQAKSTYDKRVSGNLAIHCEQDELHQLPDPGSSLFSFKSKLNF